MGPIKSYFYGIKVATYAVNLLFAQKYHQTCEPIEVEQFWGDGEKTLWHSKMCIVSSGELLHFGKSVESCDWITETEAKSRLSKNTIQVNITLRLWYH